MRVLVTGAAGFIGFHVARALLARGDAVVGFDVVNDYYDPRLKEARLAELERIAAATGAPWRFVRADLADRAAVDAAFAEGADGGPFDRVIHLAAQAGVRYSLENPVAYVQSNVLGFTHILEACRHAATPHLTYASTSSVYGGNTTMPFEEAQGVDHPLQFYAATKRANELMAHAYSHLYRLPTTGLRFFTVYGPWGRPDMAPMLFAERHRRGPADPALQRGPAQPRLHLRRRHRRGRDPRLRPPCPARPGLGPGHAPDPATSNAPFRLYNIGNSAPVELADFIAALETALGKKAIRELLPLQPGDVPDTLADSARLARAVNWRPGTPVDEGVRRFVAWFEAWRAAEAEAETAPDGAARP